MRVVHFDCFSGLSGDMVLGAVIDAGVPAEAIRGALDSLQLPIQLEIERVKRCGFVATKATIHAEDQEDYRFLPDIEAIVNKGSLTARQKDRALAVFRRLAEAEAASHGLPIERVHFHEVGALDSIADIVGAAVGLDLLEADRFTASAVAVGSGTVKGAHGIMPVPTPATATLLKGVPLAKSHTRGELCTPTGAAILTTYVSEFGDCPPMRVQAIGQGAGTKDPIETPNLLRIFVGESDDSSSADADTIYVLETNLDDCPGEVIGYTTERLFAAGALDVFTVPVQMKKQRPGVLLTVLSEPEHVAALETILFAETGTFGIRRSTHQRSKLQREAISVETHWGPVKAKRGQRAGLEVITPEYEDCARIARMHGVPLRVVMDEVQRHSKPGG